MSIFLRSSVLLFIVIFLPSYLFSQQQYLDVDDIKKEWKDFTSFQRQELINYTMFLYNEGFYERALLGYFQYLYKYPQDELESAAYYQIGKCYEKMENWDLAKNYYNRLINSSDVKRSDSNAAKYQILYINLKNRMFDEILLQTDQTKDPYQLIFRAYAHFEKLEWEDSKKAFQSAESIFDHGHYSKIIKPWYKAINTAEKAPLKKEPQRYCPQFFLEGGLFTLIKRKMH